jgi:predicted MPP superfamily phosphohydrolase
LGLADRIARAARWVYQRVVQAGRAIPLPSPVSLARRRFLEKTALAMTTAPFVAGAYGMFYERLNLEVTHRRIKIPRLPGVFEGFRIAQLSDIHIGPFMTAEEIRRYAGIANGLKPELVALTGDFVTWDPSTQSAVVEALAGVKAPFGVYGCLGNHEMWAKVEDSITRLFARRGIRILRGERALIRSGGKVINLFGVDFQSRSPMGPRGQRLVREYLQGVDRLLAPGTANILLSHNPNTFDRAVELGIDLSLAGHTHGGQVTLEFVHPDLSPSRLITPYVRGWFEKPGGQLYVNRGIGTIGVPIRFGAPPEITVYELVRS